jgi:hypothetical protein
MGAVAQGLLVAVLGAAFAAVLGWLTGPPDTRDMAAVALFLGVIGAASVDDLRRCGGAA